VFRDPERHVAALRLAFREAGIPADFDVRAPFRQVPFGSALCHLLGFASTGDRAELLAVLRSRFSGAEREAVRGLERRWRSLGTSDSRRLLQEAATVAPELVPIARELTRIAAGELGSAGIEAMAYAGKRLLVLGYGRFGALQGQRAEEDAWAHGELAATLAEAARWSIAISLWRM
jgi:hypothetical protein